MRSLFPLAVVLLPPPLLAAQFAANHLFVADPAGKVVRELDPSGNVVRTLGASTLKSPQSLVFAPDGLLYVLDERSSVPEADRLIGFGAEGDVLVSAVIGDAASFDATEARVVVGPDGLLVISDGVGAEVHVVDPAAPVSILATLSDPSLAGVGSIAITPEGHTRVSGGGDPSRFVEFDPGGAVVATHSFSSIGRLAAPPLLVPAASGVTYALLRPASPASTASSVLVALDHPDRIDPLSLDEGIVTDMTLGPDGFLWLLAEAGTKLIRASRDLAVVEEVTYVPSAVGASAIAFAPFRFAIELKGKLGREGLAPKNVSEKGHVLAWFPGAERVFVVIEDDPEKANDVATVFGRETWVLRGFAAGDAEGDAFRVDAASIGADASVNGMGRVTLRLTGSIGGANGYFKPSSASGTLAVSSPKGVLDVDLKSTKVLT